MKPRVRPKSKRSPKKPERPAKAPQGVLELPPQPEVSPFNIVYGPGPTVPNTVYGPGPTVSDEVYGPGSKVPNGFWDDDEDDDVF